MLAGLGTTTLTLDVFVRFDRAFRDGLPADSPAFFISAIKTRLINDSQKDRVVEVHDLFFASEMDYSPEPVLPARLASVLHDHFREIRCLARIHSQAPV